MLGDGKAVDLNDAVKQITASEIKPLHTQIMEFNSSHSSCNARLI